VRIQAPQTIAEPKLNQQEMHMKTLRKMLLGTAIGALLSLGTALAGDNASMAWYDAPSLVGAWQFEMTVRVKTDDCTSGDPLGSPNPFPGLVTFHEGGTMNEFASRAPSSVRSTGFGSWKQTGEHRYKARHTFMEFDSNGLLARTMVIDSRIRLNSKGSKYKAVGRLELTDVSGNVLVNAFEKKTTPAFTGLVVAGGGLPRGFGSGR
jgi:hypothetical protein